MPHSIWNGGVRFGLIAVPVKVYAAIEDKAVHFHMVHDKDGARIRQKRICAKERTEVPYEEVARGYEVRDGEYVMLSQEEIDAAAGERSRLIELREFARLEEIDPVFYDRAYHLGAGDGGEEAYRLLHDALARAGRAGVGRWVFHNREYLAAIRPRDGVLALHTMRFADELIDPRSLELREPGRAPSQRELEMARMLVDSLHERFRPERFTETYRERVLALVESKARGEEPELQELEQPGASPDLRAALEASLSAAGRPRSSRAASGRSRSRPRTAGSRS